MKRMNRLVIFVFAAALVLGAAMVVTTGEAEAKVETHTMYVGSTAQFYVYGVSLNKVKFSSSKKKVASISKKGIVKAKKEGTCYVKAMTGKRLIKKYKVIVKKKPKNKPVATPVPVTNPPSSIAPVVTAPPALVPDTTLINNQLAANISVTAIPMTSGKVLYAITNNNTVKVYTIKLSMAFYNTDGVVVGTGDLSEMHVEAGDTRYDIVTPKSGADPTKTTTSIACTQYTAYTSAKVGIPVTLTAQPKADPKDGLVITIANGTVYKAPVEGVVVYKDASGVIVDAKTLYEYIEPGQTVFVDISGPVDADYKDAVYESYEVYYHSEVFVD